MQSCATILHMSMTESQFRDLLGRYLHGKASAEEIRILDEFFESYQRQYPGDDVQQINPEVQSEILWKIHQRIGVEKKQSPARLTLWLKIAASVCIFVAAWFMIDRQLRTGEEDHKLLSTMLREQTARGQKSEVVLPDGTKAYLNANSSI